MLSARSAGELRSLAERIRHGDTSAETELVREFTQRIFVMSLVRTHDREIARELVQDVLMAVIGALRKGQLQDPDRLAAFVHGTARNLINNRLRNESQRPLMEPLPEDLAQASSIEQLEDAERARLRTSSSAAPRAGRPQDSVDDPRGGPQARGDRGYAWPHPRSGADSQAAGGEETHGSHRKEDVTNLGKFATYL